MQHKHHCQRREQANDQRGHTIEVAKHQIAVRPQALPEHNADGGEAGKTNALRR